ncbi:MAG: hypothetical protein D6714_10530, partial [Bacteroidetes bacterium]
GRVLRQRPLFVRAYGAFVRMKTRRRREAPQSNFQRDGSSPRAKKESQRSRRPKKEPGHYFFPKKTKSCPAKPHKQLKINLLKKQITPNLLKK